MLSIHKVYDDHGDVLGVQGICLKTMFLKLRNPLVSGSRWDPLVGMKTWHPKKVRPVGKHGWKKTALKAFKIVSLLEKTMIFQLAALDLTEGVKKIAQSFYPSLLYEKNHLKGSE